MKYFLPAFGFSVGFIGLGALFPTPMAWVSIALVAFLTFGVYYGALFSKGTDRWK